jgi:hypothetical protein
MGKRKWVLGFGALVLALGAGFWYASTRRGLTAGDAALYADLAPVGIHFVERGGKLYQVLTVDNQGTKDVKVPFSMHVYLYKDQSGREAIICGGDWNPSISALKAAPASATADVERYWEGWTLERALNCKGWWKVDVDTNAVVTESDESNNTRYFPNL